MISYDMADKKREAITVLLRTGATPKDMIQTVGTTRSTILRVRGRIEAGGGPHPSPRKKRKPPQSTPRAVAAVRRRIVANPTKSQHHIQNY